MVPSVIRTIALAVLIVPGPGAAARPGGGIDLPLHRRAIEEAVAIGGSSLESVRRRFHADYRFIVGKAPVDFIEVVTPFRRVVLAAEAEHRLGRRVFGQREALNTLQPQPDRIDVYAELTFHPQNTLVHVPPSYGVELAPVSTRAEAALTPGAIERLPRFGPRLDQPSFTTPYPVGAVIPSAGAQPLLGGTLIAQIAGSGVESKVYEVVVKDGKTELARARVDFARIR